MTSSAYKPFGSVITGASGSVDFSANSGFKFNGGAVQTQTNQEDMKDILKSAVGDFTERPLQIMIREIAKNLLIFTPIGWIVLAVIIGRKYKGRLNYAYANIKDAFVDVINSLGLQK